MIIGIRQVPFFSSIGIGLCFDPGLESQATVSTIIRDQNWQWPNAQTCELTEIRNSVIGDMVPSECEDQSIWTPLPNGIFPVQSDWDLLRVHKPRVTWHKLIWFKFIFLE